MRRFINDVIASVRAAPQDVESVDRHRASIKEALRASLDVKEVRATGSYARGTAIIGSDGDYFAIVSRSEFTRGGDLINSNTALRNVRDALQSRFKQTEMVKDGCAIRVDFQDASVDVVPAIWDGTVSSKDGYPVYKIPDGDGGWMRTSPDVQNRTIKEADERSRGRFKTVVQGLKAWKQSRSDTMSLKSLYLEEAVARSRAAEGVGKPNTVLLRDALRALEESGCSAMEDPHNVSDPVRATRTRAQSVVAMRAIRYAREKADKAVEAEDAGDEEEAQRYWGMVFNGAIE